MHEKEPDKLKYRNELKFLCSEAQLQVVDSRIREICSPDAHADASGIYRIRSLYFDDHRNRCFYENENGVDPREKFRIRIYNENAERITLECKQKKNGLNHKDSTGLTPELLEQILHGTMPAPAAGDPLLYKFWLQTRTRLLAPKVIVQYQRTPYVYHDGNVRITFDRFISASDLLDHFLDPTLPLQPVMPAGMHILEVKYDEFLPHYIYDVLQLGQMRQTAFSKYYTCRAFYMNQGLF